MNDDPLIIVMNKVLETNISSSRLIREFVTQYVGSLEQQRQIMVNILRENDSSRRLIYKSMNPDFLISDLYSSRKSENEVHRMSFTRFRVGSHNLACEMGRWNLQGRGRLLSHERLCRCGFIQSERHVVEECSLTDHLRRAYGFATVGNLFEYVMSIDITCKIIDKILNIYD